ncbi:MAG: hypothetical protein PHX62_09030 [Bacilli bacterium]|nr:hypothetical protein [Bacilli bacterium]
MLKFNANPSLNNKVDIIMSVFLFEFKKEKQTSDVGLEYAFSNT